MKKLIQLLIPLLLFSCASDKTDLGHSYYYLDSFEAMDVGYPDGAIIYKGKSKLHFEKVIVSREVVYATYNDLFIFAKQLKNSNSTDTTYYIINKLSDKVIGPLNLDSFEKIKASASTH